MLSQTSLRTLVQALGLSYEALKITSLIRECEPSRNAQSHVSNVTVRYPSRKMGKTIQAETHKIELAAIHEMEHNLDTLEFYDQPPPIKLTYSSPDGRKVGTLFTPSFFVIRKDRIGWEEWRSEQELIRLSQAQPNRYILDSGVWRCLPGEQYAEQFGLSYTVHSTSEINWVLQRNLIFLNDYFTDDCHAVTKEAQRIIGTFFQQQPFAYLSDILMFKDNLSSDAIYAAIARQIISCDLGHEDLTKPGEFRIYRDEETRLAYSSYKESQSLESLVSLPTVQLTSGAALRWDSRIWTILNAGENNLSLQDERGNYLDLPVVRFNDLFQQGKIEGIKLDQKSETEKKAEEILLSATPSTLAKANERYELIKSHLAGNPVQSGQVTDRTIFRYLAAWKQAEQIYGNGFVGLIPRTSDKGNRNRKLPEQTIKVMNEIIDQDYESLRHGNKWQCFSKILLKCQDLGILPPSYRTVYEAINQRPKQQQILKREGRRAAYSHTPFYWELEQTTPRHGARPFDVVHIDHTELDIELVSSINGRNLGRPWLTLMIDAYSRRILAFYLTYDPPSYRSCMMVLRECVKRHGRLPQTIVVDNGPEFHSTFFESVLARFEITKKSRPPAKARFGSICERLFGVTNSQLIHNLLGNTQITRDVRKVTRSVDPRNLATWSLPRLHLLLEQWAYQFYEAQIHPALSMSPREAFDKGIAATGARTHKMIAYNEEFIIFTSPSTSKGTAKVSPTHGIKVNSINYWSHDFRDAKIADTDVPVRYDPFDIGTAYAFVKGRWVKCFSEHYTDLKGRSEREIKLATAELRQQQKSHGKQRTLSAVVLAKFLRSAEAEEALSLQRMRDKELRFSQSADSAELPEEDQDLGSEQTDIAIAPGKADTAIAIDEDTTGQIPRSPRILEDY